MYSVGEYYYAGGVRDRDKSLNASEREWGDPTQNI
jgi:hypothetical protein